MGYELILFKGSVSVLVSDSSTLFFSAWSFLSASPTSYLTAFLFDRWERVSYDLILFKGSVLFSSPWF